MMVMKIQPTNTEITMSKTTKKTVTATVTECTDEKTKQKYYRVEYWEHSSTTVDVRANSSEEAEEKVKKMIENGVVDCSNMELGDWGYESMGEISKDEYDDTYDNVDIDDDLDDDEDDDEE